MPQVSLQRPRVDAIIRKLIATGMAHARAFPGFENLFPIEFAHADPSLPGTSAQISNYLAAVNGHANPNALYLISSGGNDATYATGAYGSNTAAANVFLLSEAQALASSIAQLQTAGARYIIVADEYQPPSASATTATYGRTSPRRGLTWPRPASDSFPRILLQSLPPSSRIHSRSESRRR